MSDGDTFWPDECPFTFNQFHRIKILNKKRVVGVVVVVVSFEAWRWNEEDLSTSCCLPSGWPPHVQHTLSISPILSLSIYTYPTLDILQLLSSTHTYANITLSLSSHLLCFSLSFDTHTPFLSLSLSLVPTHTLVKLFFRQFFSQLSR